MADEVRVTIGISKKAKEIWTNCSKTLGISQWDMTEVLFRLADPTNQQIKDLATQVAARNATIKEKNKELTKKLKMLTPEQLEKLLAQ
jgi:hypothetical protein